LNGKVGTTMPAHPWDTYLE